MIVTPLVYGRSRMKESMAFPDGDPAVTFPITFTFFLIREGAHKILVDSGCTTMPGWEMEDFCGPAAALAKVGLRPEEITHLLITHAHHDHIESASLYPNAHVFLQEQEYEKGKKYLQKDQKLTLFKEEIEPVSGVRMRCIGGHSKGSCIVELGNTVIAGDECYTRRNLEEHIPTATSADPQKSRAFIEKYSHPKYTVLLCHDE